MEIKTKELKKVEVVAGNGQAAGLKAGLAVLRLDHSAEGWTLTAQHDSGKYELCENVKRIATVNKYARCYGLEFVEVAAGNYNGEKVQIGWYILEQDEEQRDAGYECAAWYEDYVVKAGKYPIYATHAYHERDRRYMHSIKYNSITVVLEGTITGDNFSSYYCGNLIAEKYDRHVGEKTTKVLRPYDFMLVEQIKEGRAELLPDYEVVDHTFYSSHEKENITIKQIQRKH